MPWTKIRLKVELCELTDEHKTTNKNIKAKKKRKKRKKNNKKERKRCIHITYKIATE